MNSYNKQSIRLWIKGMFIINAMIFIYFLVSHRDIKDVYSANFFLCIFVYTFVHFLGRFLRRPSGQNNDKGC